MRIADLYKPDVIAQEKAATERVQTGVTKSENQIVTQEQIVTGNIVTKRGRKRVHQSNADRQKAYRLRGKAKTKE